MMKLYSRIDTKNTYFEVWGASTKHPDVKKDIESDIANQLFFESDFITSKEYAFFQWVCQCISGLSWGSYSYLTTFLEMCEPYFTEKNNYFF